MTIETTRAPEGSKTAATGAHRASAKPGQTGATGGAAGEGFADLMSLLSASDAGSDAGSDAVLPGSDALLISTSLPEMNDKNIPLAPDDKGLIAIHLIPTTIPVPVSSASFDANLTTPATGAQIAVAQASSKAPVNPLVMGDKPSVPSEATLAAPATGELVAVAQASGKAPAKPLGDKWRAADKPDAASTTTQASSAKGHDAAAEVTSLLGNRPTALSSGISQVQTELREVKTAVVTPAPVTAADTSRVAAAMASLSGVPSSPERQEVKPQSRQSGSGMEGMFGAALADKLGISPTYEVAPTSAVVPDTQVAETVSYWATHGVQSAELTLDGLGSDPVEVRITVEGDQAQVDFRSNQPEVRQALENASAQLKAMLSGEGLQLTGMSVGTSGQGQTQGDGRQAKPASRQTKLVALEPASAATGRSVNPSVGRALDLYV